MRGAPDDSSQKWQSEILMTINDNVGCFCCTYVHLEYFCHFGVSGVLCVMCANYRLLTRCLIVSSNLTAPTIFYWEIQQFTHFPNAFLMTRKLVPVGCFQAFSHFFQFSALHATLCNTVPSHHPEPTQPTTPKPFRPIFPKGCRAQAAKPFTVFPRVTPSPGA